MLKHLGAGTVEQYHEALRDGLEGRVRTRLEADFDRERRKLVEELLTAKAGELEERILRAEHQVIEDILMIKCPRCSSAILDFEGCFALSCARCGAGLCGWCMEDCGKDSHPHVATCKQKLHGDKYHAPKALFDEAANLRRAKAVAQFVRTSPEDLREPLKERLRPHLLRLAIKERAIDW